MVPLRFALLNTKHRLPLSLSLPLTEVSNFEQIGSASMPNNGWVDSKG
jgi:hypothetical protein